MIDAFYRREFIMNTPHVYNKKTIVSIFLAVLFVLFLLITIYLIKVYPFYGFEMTFFGTGGNSTLTDVEKIYNVEELSKQIDEKNPVYIYAAPQKTDYKIAKTLGFGDTYEYDDSAEERIYSLGKAYLSVDQYGGFLYLTRVKNPTFPFPYTDKETMEMAKEILKEYDLWNDSINEWSTNYVKTTDSKGNTTILRKETVFWIRSEDGKNVVNQKIHVCINGNKELVRIRYDVKGYSKHSESKLISIEEAFQKIEEENFGFSHSLDNEPNCELKEIIFETVEISYREAESTDGKNLLQPLYVFKGTVKDITGKTGTFTCMVQANVVNSK